MSGPAGEEARRVALLRLGGRIWDDVLPEELLAVLVLVGVVAVANGAGAGAGAGKCDGARGRSGAGEGRVYCFWGVREDVPDVGRWDGVEVGYVLLFRNKNPLTTSVVFGLRPHHAYDLALVAEFWVWGMWTITLTSLFSPTAWVSDTLSLASASVAWPFAVPLLVTNSRTFSLALASQILRSHFFWGLGELGKVDMVTRDGAWTTCKM